MAQKVALNPLTRPSKAVPAAAVGLWELLATSLAFLEHHRDSVDGQQLFARLQCVMLISSKHRHHR